MCSSSRSKAPFSILRNPILKTWPIGGYTWISRRSSWGCKPSMDPTTSPVPCMGTFTVSTPRALGVTSGDRPWWERLPLESGVICWGSRLVIAEMMPVEQQSMRRWRNSLYDRHPHFPTLRLTDSPVTCTEDALLPRLPNCGVNPAMYSAHRQAVGKAYNLLVMAGGESEATRAS
jgi:hypothetical protein